MPWNCELVAMCWSSELVRVSGNGVAMTRDYKFVFVGSYSHQVKMRLNLVGVCSVCKSVRVSLTGVTMVIYFMIVI